MERGSDKHAPALDDQLKHEEHALLHGGSDEGRSEPRRAEAPGADEPGFGRRTDQDEHPGGAPSQQEIEARAAFAAAFTPGMFPTGRDALIEQARRQFADDELIDSLRKIPDRTYESVGQVWDLVRQRG